jgi:HEAT repeat protein
MRLESVEQAVEMLTGPDPDGRKMASVYLAEAGDEQGLSALVAALGHPLIDVRINAAEALGASGHPAAVQPLVSSLLDESQPGPVRQAAARSLGVLASSQGVPALTQVLHDVLDDPQRTDHNVVRAAARALAAAGPYVEDDETRAQAVTGLVGLLRADSAILRQVAVQALGAFGDARILPALVGALADPAWLVRQAAAQVIGELGDDANAERLNDLLRDSNRAVRIAAADALEKIGQRYGE